MSSIDTVVIGAGHAGLAVSRLLTLAGHEHVVLERGRVAERWRSERWDSLHLLTPSWMTRLPGWPYSGPDPEGYLSAGQLVRSLERYAGSFGAPVRDRTTVEAVETAAGAAGGRYLVVTDRGTWLTRSVVVATGPHGTPYLPPALAAAAPAPGGAEVVTANRYRNPDRLPAGAVLVVGASSSGVQIADELNRAGREVVLAVGRHTRMPRRYRGMDAFWWLEATGRLSRTIDTMPDPVAARREPSLQLIGRNDPEQFSADLDLGTLQTSGVRLAGRLRDVQGSRVHFADDLSVSVADADARMTAFLDTVDHHAARTGLADELWPVARPRPVRPRAAPRTLDLAHGFGAVVVASGYRPDLGWLRLPVLDPDGSIRQSRGVTGLPGVYVVGQRFQHRRDSGFIDGARHDAHAVVRHLLGLRDARTVGAGEAGPGEESVA